MAIFHIKCWNQILIQKCMKFPPCDFCLDEFRQLSGMWCLSGLPCEGIYRMSGVKSKVQSLKDAYNKGSDVYLQEHEPNIVASLLKQFLRQLPEPLLTTKLIPKFEQASSKCSVIFCSSCWVRVALSWLGYLRCVNGQLVSRCIPLPLLFIRWEICFKSITANGTCSCPIDYWYSIAFNWRARFHFLCRVSVISALFAFSVKIWKCHLLIYN